jgi:hypothetical protein
MINNYIFKKNITKRDLNYFLELNIPSIFDNFLYKIYGSNGFYNYGKYSSNKNIDSNNYLLIEIDKVQILFISIIFKETEYYDFLNMFDSFDERLHDNSYKKNIKINIERKNNIENIQNILSLNDKFKLIKKKEEDEDEDDDEEDEDEEDDDEEDKEDDDEDKEEDDEEDKEDDEEDKEEEDD